MSCLMYKAYRLQIESWSSGEDFLTQLCKRSGKLLKKGEPDLDAVARMVFQDFQRGRLPYFTIPPNSSRQVTSRDGVLTSHMGGWGHQGDIYMILNCFLLNLYWK